MNCSFLHKLNTACINHSIMFLAEPYKHRLTDIHSPERSPQSPGCLSHKSVVFAQRPCQNYSVNYRAHCVHCTAIRINRTTGQVNFLHLKYIKHSKMNMLFFPQSLRFCASRTVYMQIMQDEDREAMWMDMISFCADTKGCTCGRQTHTFADNTWPHRSRASLTSSFALDCVVARTLLQ